MAPVIFFGECHMESISKQKKYLSENLIVESLTMYGSNQEDIKEFLQAKSGSVLVEYLNNDAWNDDINNDTKVFLVRDKKTRKIAYYYALNCGILYKELNTIEMSVVEHECVEKLVKAIKRNNSEGLSKEEQDAAYELLGDAYALFDEKIEDSERVTVLISHAQEQAEMKKEREEASSQISDSEFVKNVQETFPAIDIKFLCKDGNYKPDIEIGFKFGVYVFWEIIVPHILKISELVGCKYVYLFAADNSEIQKADAQMDNAIIYSKEYDMDLEEDILDKESSSDEDVKKLVSYYINNLKFRPVSEYIILKPHFERTCYTLIQDVADLQHKREAIWYSHDQDNEMGLNSE